MKKAVIFYLKNGKFYTETFQVPNKHKILKSIFKEYSNKVYKVCDDVDFLYMNNVCFYQKIKIECPKTTRLVLENCVFHENFVNFLGGNVDIICPKMPKQYYFHFISGENLEKFHLRVEDDNFNDLTLAINAKNITILGNEDAKYKCYNFMLNGNNITIENVEKIKSINISCQRLLLCNSNLKFQDFLDVSSSIQTDSMFLMASEISNEIYEKVKCRNEKFISSLDEIEIIDSKSLIKKKV